MGARRDGLLTKTCVRFRAAEKPMKNTVEGAHLVNGDVVSVRRLSLRRERQGALRAVGMIVAGYVLAMAGVFAVARMVGRGVYAPPFLAAWVVACAAMSLLAYRRVSRRLGRYRLGCSLDADAYAPADVDLVRRAGERFDLTVVPGMHGHVDGGRSPMAIEALLDGRWRTVDLDAGLRAEIHVGDATFTDSSQQAAQQQARAVPEIPRGFWRLF